MTTRSNEGSAPGDAGGSALQALDLTAWIARLGAHPELLRMGHEEPLSLGLGWLYYGLARLVHPRRAVVIGSDRGLVSLVLGKALRDNREPGEVIFIEPSAVDQPDAERMRASFETMGVDNVRHFATTTQRFVETEDFHRLGDLGLLVIEGCQSEAQARFDYRAFEDRLAPHGLALFHDGMAKGGSMISGRVRSFIAELERDRRLQVLDLPFGAGLTLVRKAVPGAEPLREGSAKRPRGEHGRGGRRHRIP